MSNQLEAQFDDLTLSSVDFIVNLGHKSRRIRVESEMRKKKIFLDKQFVPSTWEWHGFQFNILIGTWEREKCFPPRLDCRPRLKWKELQFTPRRETTLCAVTLTITPPAIQLWPFYIRKSDFCLEKIFPSASDKFSTSRKVDFSGLTYRSESCRRESGG